MVESDGIAGSAGSLGCETRCGHAGSNGGVFCSSPFFGPSENPGNNYDASLELELPTRAIETYLRRNIDFSLDSENRRGLDLYYQHAARLGLVSKAKPIEWVDMKAVTARS